MTHTRYPNRATRGAPWTEAEDAEVIRLRRSGLSLEQVAASLPGRTAAGCKTRYQKLTAPGAEDGRPPAVYEGAKPRAENAMLARLAADGGFPVLREVKVGPDRFGVALGSRPIVADAVYLRCAA